MMLLLAMACLGGEPGLCAAPPPVTEAAPADRPWVPFGQPFASEAARPGAEGGRGGSMPVEGLVANAASLAGQTVTVQGTVRDVCQQAGCWLVLGGTEHADVAVRIRMKDHAFAVDKQGAGSEALVHGTVIVKQVDPQEAAHFAAEAARPEVMPENHAAVVVEIEATGVMLRPGA